MHFQSCFHHLDGSWDVVKNVMVGCIVHKYVDKVVGDIMSSDPATSEAGARWPRRGLVVVAIGKISRCFSNFLTIFYNLALDMLHLLDIIYDS
jgi:hypothetical protein